jgi:hypothetical protein
LDSDSSKWTLQEKRSIRQWPSLASSASASFFFFSNQKFITWGLITVRRHQRQDSVQDIYAKRNIRVHVHGFPILDSICIQMLLPHSLTNRWQRCITSCRPESQHLPLFLPLACISSPSHWSTGSTFAPSKAKVICEKSQAQSKQCHQ